MLRCETQDTRPAARRAAANRSACSDVSSPALSPSPSSHRLTWSNWHSLSAAAEGEYACDPSQLSNPAAYGANGPDTTGTHTFPPIVSSCRIAEHESAKPRQENHDYVEHLTAVTGTEQGERRRPGVGST
jgi:hypothetical protein